MNRASQGKRLEGFSLLELVIAVALLTSTALAATLVLVPVARETRLRREVGVASAAAKRVLEKIQAMPFNEIVTVYPQSYVEALPQLPAGSILVQYEDPAADPLRVQVQLSWDSGEIGAMQRTFSTVRTE